MTLPGIELVRRVEGILDLAEDLRQLAVLLAQELGARQPAALRAGDRPARLEHDVVDPAGQRLELGAIARVGQIEKRPEPQPALAGIGVEGPGDVLLLEQALQRAAGPPRDGPAGPPRRRRTRPAAPGREIASEAARPAGASPAGARTPPV